MKTLEIGGGNFPKPVQNTGPCDDPQILAETSRMLALMDRQAKNSCFTYGVQSTDTASKLAATAGWLAESCYSKQAVIINAFSAETVTDIELETTIDAIESCRSRHVESDPGFVVLSGLDKLVGHDIDSQTPIQKKIESKVLSAVGSYGLRIFAIAQWSSSEVVSNPHAQQMSSIFKLNTDFSQIIPGELKLGAELDLTLASPESEFSQVA